MAHELEHLDTTGLTIYAKPLPIVASPWGDDAVAMTETGTTGYYSADVASPANRYAVYQQAGASPAATDIAVATIDRSAATGSGTGDIPVIPPAITRDGSGVDNAIVRVYLASDYALGNYELRGEAVTGPDGVVVAPLMLNAGSYKAVVWDAQSRRSQVFDLEVSA